MKDLMPIGIELIGKKFNEDKLIEMAYSYEQHSFKRKIPNMPEPNNLLIHLSIPELNNLFTLIGNGYLSKSFKKWLFAVENFSIVNFF